ncbi:MAG: hypothetical protein U1E89_03865 [Burkholderiaceae bacterium]
MKDLTTMHQRAGRGTLIVRASTVAVGLAACVGLPSTIGSAAANNSFALR